MTTTATLAAALDALARVDDGTATGADRSLAARLDGMLQPSVERIRDIEHLADLDRWRDWHDQHCDGDDCDHYEPEEGR